MELTKQQNLAATLEGNSLLVSAAAGSGKTSVLTERVVRILTDSSRGTDADRLMILTYTNAAAAEMRSRISARLREMALADPNNSYIRRQLTLLPAAKICTIHSACLDIIRTNFQKCDLDPQFTVGDENRLELMRISELEDFVEEIFEMADTDKGALTVIDYFTKGRDDSALSEAIDNGSRFLLSQPFEDAYIEKVCSFSAKELCEKVFAFAQKELADVSARYKALIERSGWMPKLVDFYSDERDFVKLVAKQVADGNYDKAYEFLKEYKFKSHPQKPKDKTAEEWEPYKDARAELKTRIIEIYSEYIYAPFEVFEEDRNRELEIIKEYLILCKKFNERLFKKRKKLRLVSFDDIEKYALMLLIERVDGENPVKTPLAKELSERIDEIIVDEFQDCNFTQDLIFRALSKNGTNVFMVGDVKQSIYRFRGAQPDIFLQKQLSSTAITQPQELSQPSRVDLSCNFRSDAKILDFVNTVFTPLMTAEFGGIDYSDGHKLMPNPDNEKSEHSKVEVSLLVSGVDENSPTDKLSKTEAEAQYVADKIKELLSGATIYDIKKKCERTVTAGDIAILMQAPKTDGAIYEKALSVNGISFINNNPSENYLDTLEVRNVLAFLQTIDNPYNDIPLVTLMTSDFFGFSAKELGQIRAGNRRMLFYDAVRKYAEKDPKTKAFVKNLEYLRTLSQTVDVYGIISAVYESSGILVRLSSKEGGEEAKANLMLLLDYAANFESDRYRGLFAFISYIVRLAGKKGSIPAARLKTSGDSVNILSIHRSKGLEYPVVFVVGMGNDIRNSTKGDVLLGSDFAGSKIRDNIRHREFYAPSRNLIAAMDREEDLDEYMRLLYVALTRAVSRLYVTGVMGVKSVERMMRAAYNANGEPKKYDVYQSPSFMRWMFFSLIKNKAAKPVCQFAGVPYDICTGESDFEIVIENVTELEKAAEQEKSTCKVLNLDKQLIKNYVTRAYSFAEDTELPAKLSVSEIKGMRIAEEDGAKALFHSRISKKPKFLEDVSAADKGNATHRFLQFCDFEAVCNMETLEKEKNRLIECEFITKKEAALVEDEKVVRFLTSDIMKELSCSEKCFKEERFLFTVDACDILDTQSKEQIIVQGILDCLYIRGGKAVIVDYKTDRVDSPKVLADRYRSQLDMYEIAVKRIKNIDTDRKYIYSFCLEQFIEV